MKIQRTFLFKQEELHMKLTVQPVMRGVYRFCEDHPEAPVDAYLVVGSKYALNASGHATLYSDSGEPIGTVANGARLTVTNGQREGRTFVRFGAVTGWIDAADLSDEMPDLSPATGLVPIQTNPPIEDEPEADAIDDLEAPAIETDEEGAANGSSGVLADAASDEADTGLSDAAPSDAVPSAGDGETAPETTADGRSYPDLHDPIPATLENESGERELYVFDTKQGVWMREDSAAVRYFAAIGDTLYMLDAAGGLWQLTGNGSEYEDAAAEDEPPVEWMLETGDIGYERQAAQYVGAIQLHASCQPQCPLYVDIRYEGSGPWHTVYKHTPMERRSMVVPIIPRRARLIRLRIRGSGDFRLYSLTMRVETGSDQYAAW
jgi:hypothetical protein